MYRPDAGRVRPALSQWHLYCGVERKREIITTENQVSVSDERERESEIEQKDSLTPTLKSTPAAPEMAGGAVDHPRTHAAPSLSLAQSLLQPKWTPPSFSSMVKSIPEFLSWGLSFSKASFFKLSLEYSGKSPNFSRVPE